MRGRVLLVNSSRLLADILRESLGDSEIEQIRSATTPDELRAAIGGPRANLVVVCVRSGELQQVQRLVTELMRLKVVVVVEEGDHGVMYELRPQPTAIGPLRRDVFREAVLAGSSTCP